jgi:uncharacterized protein YndB with AHSA1/START domain
MTATAQAKPATQREVTITRVFNAPRSLVFKMWTDPKHLAQWWGPREFTNPVCEIDVRPGGKIYIVMRGPKGTPYDGDFPMSGMFQEIKEPERIVFTSVAEDKDGNAQIKGLNTITFTEANGKTTLTIVSLATAIVPIGAQMIEGMEAGWTQSIDKLEELVARSR